MKGGDLMDTIVSLLSYLSIVDIGGARAIISPPFELKI
jgi:hypothetical protein